MAITNLPKRPHIGCDPMCADCIKADRDLEKAIKPVIRLAMVAFWEIVKTELPECSHGELDASELQELVDIASQTVSSWAFNNLPIQGVENVWAGKTAEETSSRVIPFKRAT